MFQIILSKKVEALHGSFSRKDSYYIQHRKNGFFVQKKPASIHRSQNPQTYWAYIVQIAQMCGGIMIEDICIDAQDVQKALLESHHFVAADRVETNAEDAVKRTYNARDILNLKTTFGL